VNPPSAQGHRRYQLHGIPSSQRGGGDVGDRGAPVACSVADVASCESSYCCCPFGAPPLFRSIISPSVRAWDRCPGKGQCIRARRLPSA